MFQIWKLSDPPSDEPNITILRILHLVIISSTRFPLIFILITKYQFSHLNIASLGY